MSITVSEDQLRAVHESVATGEYASASDVLRDALLLWQRRRHEDAERLDAVRARLRRALEDPRPDMSGQEVQASLDALFAQADDGARRA